MNWVDILVIIAFIRICYISVKSGLPIEIFKLLGTVSAIYFSLHYYTILSDSVQKRVSTGNLPLEFLDFAVFVLCAMIGYAAFVLLRMIFYRFIQMEAVPNLNKWGGLMLSVIRGFLFASLIIFAMGISSITYLKMSVKKSYLGDRLFAVSPKTYAWVWSSITSKFMSGEKFNQTINEAQKRFAQE